MQDYQQALEHYYAVEFSNPDNLKVLRPIAWCLFVSGRYADAADYYHKLSGQENNPSDLLNYGHVMLCQNKASKATDLYLRSVASRGNSLADFINSFTEDIPYLLSAGISRERIRLVTDMIRFRFDGTYML
jgi:tetratricopeptide (TPR) repeat protein